MKQTNFLKFGCVSATVFFCTQLLNLQAQYFQQKVDYQIDVVLDTEKDRLKANLDLVYTNNSPNELSEIYMHLWPNAYQNANTPLGKQVHEQTHIKIPKYNGYISALDFKVNEQAVSVSYVDKYQEIAILKLNTPLKKGESIRISTPFEVKIPDGNISRLGKTHQLSQNTAYMITQWYPKPAVYDANGWNTMAYLSQGEFYSEFGSFDVKITLPSEYVVGATGELQSEAEKMFLQDKIARKSSTVYQNKALKTIQFKQENIHDFAFFANADFLVDADTVLLSNAKTVVCLAMYTPDNAPAWKNAASMIKKSVFYYSERIGNYPYAYCTAVDGTISAGGGMEYPMVTIIGEMDVERTILHEVGHNWFYGILGSNERKHPWLDEGINSYYEDAYYRDSTSTTFGKGLVARIMSMISGNEANEMIHTYMSRHNAHQTLNLPAETYSYVNYGIEVYQHTAGMFHFLEQYLGRESFDKAMKSYYSSWEFKHPNPNDLKNELEKNSSKNLSWFFDGLLNLEQKPDFKVRYENGKVFVENKYPYALPVKVSYFKGKVLVSSTWLEPFSGEVEIPNNPSAEKLVINHDKVIWEKSFFNNEVEFNKACKTCDMVRFSPLMAFPSTTKNYFTASPVYAWNNYNKSMLGIQIHNKGILPKKHEFYLLPMVSINPVSFAGMGDYRFRIWPSKSLVAFMDFGVNYRRFAYDYFDKAQNYQRLELRMNGEFKRKEKNKPKRSGIAVNYAFINKDISLFNMPSQLNYGLLSASYWYENFNRKYPLFVSAGIESKQEFTSKVLNSASSSIKIWAEARQDYYYLRKKRVQLRAFAAVYAEPYAGYVNNRIRMNGWSGIDDYGMENFYFGRTERAGSFLGNQFIEREGNFKVYAPNAQANIFLMSLNIKFDIPIPFVPIGFYSDLGISGNKGFNVGTGNNFNSFDFYSNSGLYLDIFPQVFSVYFPIPQTSTKNLGLVNNNFKNPYFSYVRFSLNLLKLNPTKFREYIRMIK